MAETLTEILGEAQNVLTQNTINCLMIALLNGKAKANQPVLILINSSYCDNNRTSVGLKQLTFNQKHIPPSPNSLALPAMCWACPVSLNIRQHFQNLSQRATSLK
jgi:hypothetical protein